MADLVIRRHEHGGKNVEVVLKESTWAIGPIEIATAPTSLDGNAGEEIRLSVNLTQAQFVRDALDYLIQKAVSK